MWTREPIDGLPLSTTEVAHICLPHHPYLRPGDHDEAPDTGPDGHADCFRMRDPARGDRLNGCDREDHDGDIWLALINGIGISVCGFWLPLWMVLR